MTAAAKIRLMLAIISASLLVTAIVVQKAYTPKSNLVQTAQAIENALHTKEVIVNNFLHNKEKFDKLKTLSDDQSTAIATIDELTTNDRIWLTTQLNGQLDFWSGIKILPTAAQPIKEGRSFIKRPNGYFEAIRKTQGSFSAVFFIPVKSGYSIRNKYLNTNFDSGLGLGHNLELADFTDKDVYNVHSIDNQYLFSVKLVTRQVNSVFFFFVTILWLINFLLICALANVMCRHIAHTYNLSLSILLLATFIILLRFVNLYLNWPGYVMQFSIFNHGSFYGGPLFPSLGDFCINLLLLCWLAGYIYSYRYKLANNIRSKTAFVVVVCVMVFFGSVTLYIHLFQLLVTRSAINFDVNNVLTLTIFSFSGLIIVCVAFLTLYFLAETLLVVSGEVKIPLWHKILIFILAIIAFTVYISVYINFNITYILIGVIIAVRARSVWNYVGKINATIFITLIIISAFIASAQLSDLQTQREHNYRKKLIKKLQAGDDANADLIFKKIEHNILTDAYLIRYFNDSTRNTDYLRMHFRKTYFDGYMSKYDFKIYEFDKDGRSIAGDKTYVLDNFKDLVMYSSFKVSSFFYRENDSFGFQSYFALLPITYAGKNLGTFVVALRSKPIQFNNAFPELLVDGQLNLNNDYKGYSYAYYSDNKLVSQSGTYIYSLFNKEFNAEPHKFTFINSGWYKSDILNPFSYYNHLVFKPGARKLIVISKQELPVVYAVTSVTFFFLLLLIFNALIVLCRWLWVHIRLVRFSGGDIIWQPTINFGHILYRTRIQFSMIVAVVITLLLVGIITFVSLTTQYKEQQDSNISDRIGRISSAFESHIDNETDPLKKETQVSFNTFAESYATDLTLFNRNGNLLFTTQPKLYSAGLIMPTMNGRAFIFLNKLQKSEYINQETIGDLKYKAGYAPIRNNKNETIAYLQLPFFSNEADYNQRVGSLLNAMINIYALIFIAIGIFAILVARQITSPLSFIQQKLGKIVYGRKNEPIVWKRDDEIGALVQEYNSMIVALEASATKLAQSERESAWREMAKQVAHEIKNPLTPLKLGLQLLDKSWRDKDPKFDLKFERFSKSFVEQIESLSNIASEFSAFAKMPDTKMELLDVIELLNQAVIIFKHMDNLTINYTITHPEFYVNADRDQILRCFNNLLKNAIEAMPPERPGIIDINYITSENSILINIKDNGNGIPDNVQVKIFEPNFTTKSSGTGLGLAFVKNSIENAGGRVWFETTIGEGTEFYLELPKA